jgi:hypothetical protein
MSAVAHETPKDPLGVLVMPEVYQVRLIVGERVFRQPVVIRMDPRVKALPADLELQFKLSKSIDAAIRDTAKARADVRTRLAAASGDAAAKLQSVRDALDQAAAPLSDLYQVLQAADARPTATAEAAVANVLQHVTSALEAYHALQ